MHSASLVTCREEEKSLVMVCGWEGRGSKGGGGEGLGCNELIFRN